MGKYDVITAVAEAFDRAEKAEAEVSRLTRTIPCEAEGKGLSRLDRIALEVGRKEIVKASLSYWHEVRVSRDDETEVVSVEPCDRWARRVVEKIPDEFGRKDFFEYFDLEFRSRYEEERAAAIERFNMEGEE